MNETILNLSNYSYINPPVPIVLSFNDVLNSFSNTFIFRMELITFAFFGVMLYLQYYTKQLEKIHRRNKKWSEHVEQVLNIEPILMPNLEFSGRDKTLILLSDILFLPVVAFVLIFVGYETGWWI